MQQNGLTIWSEKIPDKGEDAKPTFIIDESKQKVILAVYDGMGGAGSAMYDYEGKTYSGAFISANETKKYFEIQAKEYLQAKLQISDILTSIEGGLFTQLQSLASSIDKNPSRIKSNLIKRLPTTIAAVICEKNREQINITCLWAGDSRCYILSPESGLTQLTNDDLKGDNDAMRNLRSDAPMSNYCNADGAFKINIANGSQSEPFIILAATDGCFGYLPSPFHFEDLLLKTLMNERTKDFDDWRNQIIEEIQKVTGDDYSLALHTFGFENFTSLQDKFDARSNIIQSDFMNRYVAVEKIEFETKISYEQAASDKEKTLNELWNNYKVKYQNYYGKR